MPAKKQKYTNVWSNEKVMAETNNLEKLMDRCWYCLAGTLVKPGTEGFWEINWWDGEARDGKRIFTNQTIVTTANGKRDVSPCWFGGIVNGKMQYEVRHKLCC